MNILADKFFRAGKRNQVHLVAQRELENGQEEEMNLILEWFYGRHCSVRTPKTSPFEGLLSGSRVFTSQTEMFVVVDDVQEPALPSVYGDKNQVVEVATPGSGILAGSFLIEIDENEVLVYKHIVRENQVTSAKTKIRQSIKQVQRFNKLMSRKVKVKKKDLAFPEGPQPGDSTGTLWQSPSLEHISFRAWRSAQSLVNAFGV